jgi:hypothetical protein
MAEERVVFGVADACSLSAGGFYIRGTNIVRGMRRLKVAD